MLEKILKALEENNPNHIFNYTIPNLLNTHNYPKAINIGKEVIVNPYEFYSDLIKNHILIYKQPNIDYNQSLSQIKQHKNKVNWHKKSIFYSLMARTSTTWDSDRDNKLSENNLYDLNELGSFVKSLSLLPYLKSIGVDTLYFLPLSKYSTYRSKGDLGSSYAVLSFTELDPNLKDSLTGDKTTLEEEFKAFVEALHLLDMRIMIDIIPRTNALDSDLILEHPEWFYWINSSDLDIYSSPYIDTIVGETLPPIIDYMPDVYNHPDTKKHLSLFKENPKKQNPKKWSKVVELVKKGMNILDATTKVYQMTVAPAFSDNINDIQPPWYDVTFFRIYLDHPENAKKYLSKDQAPYILFDTIKSNLHPGKLPNYPLWEKLANIIPYYQKEYGIDGARIDMGHALPDELIHLILNKAREIDHNFIFVAEELDMKNAKKAKKLGYDMIIGNGFIMETRILEGKLHEFVKSLYKLPLPSFALGETHDTPRLAGRENGKHLTNLLTILNLFIPNGIPFINSGQEFYEVQPMNLGIDAYPEDRFHLDKDDPLYGKLALFDKYGLHYKNDHDLVNHLKVLKTIRKKYLSKMTKRNFHLFEVTGPYIGIAFGYKIKDQLLLIIGNTNTSYKEYMEIHLEKFNYDRKIKVIFETTKYGDANVIGFASNGNPYALVAPGEVKILIIG